MGVLRRRAVYAYGLGALMAADGLAGPLESLTRERWVPLDSTATDQVRHVLRATAVISGNETLFGDSKAGVIAWGELSYFAFRGITDHAPVGGLGWYCCGRHRSQEGLVYCLRYICFRFFRPLVGILLFPFHKSASHL